MIKTETDKLKSLTPLTGTIIHETKQKYTRKPTKNVKQKTHNYE